MFPVLGIVPLGFYFLSEKVKKTFGVSYNPDTMGHDYGEEPSSVAGEAAVHVVSFTSDPMESSVDIFTSAEIKEQIQKPKPLHTGLVSNMNLPSNFPLPTEVVQVTPPVLCTYEDPHLPLYMIQQFDLAVLEKTQLATSGHPTSDINFSISLLLDLSSYAIENSLSGELYYEGVGSPEGYSKAIACRSELEEFQCSKVTLSFSDIFLQQLLCTKFGIMQLSQQRDICFILAASDCKFLLSLASIIISSSGFVGSAMLNENYPSVAYSRHFQAYAKINILVGVTARIFSLLEQEICRFDTQWILPFLDQSLDVHSTVLLNVGFKLGCIHLLMTVESSTVSYNNVPIGNNASEEFLFSFVSQIDHENPITLLPPGRFSVKLSIQSTHVQSDILLAPKDSDWIQSLNSLSANSSPQGFKKRPMSKECLVFNSGHKVWEDNKSTCSSHKQVYLFERDIEPQHHASKHFMGGHIPVKEYLSLPKCSNKNQNTLSVADIHSSTEPSQETTEHTPHTIPSDIPHSLKQLSKEKTSASAMKCNKKLITLMSNAKSVTSVLLLFMSVCYTHMLTMFCSNKLLMKMIFCYFFKILCSVSYYYPREETFERISIKAHSCLTLIPRMLMKLKKAAFQMLSPYGGDHNVTATSLLQENKNEPSITATSISDAKSSSVSAFVHQVMSTCYNTTYTVIYQMSSKLLQLRQIFFRIISKILCLISGYHRYPSDERTPIKAWFLFVPQRLMRLVKVTFHHYITHKIKRQSSEKLLLNQICEADQNNMMGLPQENSSESLMVRENLFHEEHNLPIVEPLSQPSEESNFSIHSTSEPSQISRTHLCTPDISPSMEHHTILVPGSEHLATSTANADHESPSSSSLSAPVLLPFMCPCCAILLAVFFFVYKVSNKLLQLLLRQIFSRMWYIFNSVHSVSNYFSGASDRTLLAAFPFYFLLKFYILFIPHMLMRLMRVAFHRYILSKIKRQTSKEFLSPVQEDMIQTPTLLLQENIGESSVVRDNSNNTIHFPIRDPLSQPGCSSKRQFGSDLERSQKSTHLLRLSTSDISHSLKHEKHKKKHCRSRPLRIAAPVVKHNNSGRSMPNAESAVSSSVSGPIRLPFVHLWYTVTFAFIHKTSSKLLQLLWRQVFSRMWYIFNGVHSVPAFPFYFLLKFYILFIPHMLMRLMIVAFHRYILSKIKRQTSKECLSPVQEDMIQTPTLLLQENIGDSSAVRDNSFHKKNIHFPIRDPLSQPGCSSERQFESDLERTHLLHRSTSEISYSLKREKLKKKRCRTSLARDNSLHKKNTIHFPIRDHLSQPGCSSERQFESNLEQSQKITLPRSTSDSSHSLKHEKHKKKRFRSKRPLRIAAPVVEHNNSGRSIPNAEPAVSSSVSGPIRLPFVHLWYTVTFAFIHKTSSKLLQLPWRQIFSWITFKIVHSLSHYIHIPRYEASCTSILLLLISLILLSLLSLLLLCY